MKILPISKYIFKNNVFILDTFSIRRFSILLTFIITILIGLISSNLDALIIHESVAEPIKHKYTKQLKVDKTYAAIKSYIKQSNNELTNDEISLYAKHILTYTNEFKVDPFLIVGLMQVESRFDRYAISSVGALGLTQVMPKWHKEKIKILRARFGHFDLFEPEHNIAMGIMIFAEYKQLSKGSKEKALLRYNGSLHHEAPTYAKLVMAERVKAKKHEVNV